MKLYTLGGDWTFVTRNSTDFRGPATNPGVDGQYTEVDLYPGLYGIRTRRKHSLNDSLDELSLKVSVPAPQ